MLPPAVLSDCGTLDPLQRGLCVDFATGDGKQFDLLIKDDDIHFDGIDTLQTTDGRPSIAQDVTHAIRESQLLTGLVAQRNSLERKHIYVQIETLVEDDERIIPGTATVTESDTETVWIQAQTYDYQDVAFYL